MTRGRGLKFRLLTNSAVVKLSGLLNFFLDAFQAFYRNQKISTERFKAVIAFFASSCKSRTICLTPVTAEVIPNHLAIHSFIHLSIYLFIYLFI